MKIGFIGSGKMATALMKSVLKAGLAKGKDIMSSDKSEEQLRRVKGELGVNTANSNKDVVRFSDVVLLCVKPQDIDMVLDEIRGEVKNKLVISIAAGVTIKRLESKIKGKVIRVMPNTPCLVGEMAAGYAPGKNVSEKDLEIVKKILNTGGIAIQVNEKDLDAITGLSGSGPAFVAYLIDAFTEAGIKQGLERDVAYKLAVQTFLGTAKLLKETGISPKELIDMVSSPNGTTIAGRGILENSDVNKIMEKTVSAATKRSRELGNG